MKRGQSPVVPFFRDGEGDSTFNGFVLSTVCGPCSKWGVHRGRWASQTTEAQLWHHFPQMQEQMKEVCGSEDNLDLFIKKKAPVAPPKQEYVGMSHPLLPKRSLLDSETAYEQM